MGVKQAQRDQPKCGTDSSCYADYSISDCSDTDFPSNVHNLDAYCHGFVKGYYDTAGLPQFDSTGR